MFSLNVHVILFEQINLISQYLVIFDDQLSAISYLIAETEIRYFKCIKRENDNKKRNATIRLVHRKIEAWHLKALCPASSAAHCSRR